MDYFFLSPAHIPRRSAPMETVVGIIPLSTYRASGVVEVSNNCSFRDALQKLRHGCACVPRRRCDGV